MDSVREIIEEKFSKFHSQKMVVLKLMEYGLAVRNQKIYCNDIEIDHRSIANSLGVDVRVVKSAVSNIESDRKLSKVFSLLRSTIHLGEVAPVLGLGEIVIEAVDSRYPGIIYTVAEIMSKRGISIRQAIGDDADFTEDPKLYIITDSPIPSDIIPKIKESKKIKGVILY